MRFPPSGMLYPGGDGEIVLTTDFAAVRLHMERAFDCLRGDDALSGRLREALGLALDAVALAQHTRQTADIIRFPGRTAVAATAPAGSRSFQDRF